MSIQYREMGHLQIAKLKKGMVSPKTMVPAKAYLQDHPGSEERAWIERLYMEKIEGAKSDVPYPEKLKAVEAHVVQAFADESAPTTFKLHLFGGNHSTCALMDFLTEERAMGREPPLSRHFRYVQFVYYIC